MANRSAKINNIEDKVSFVCGDLKDKELSKSMPKFDVVTVNLHIS